VLHLTRSQVRVGSRRCTCELDRFGRWILHCVCQSKRIWHVLHQPDRQRSHLQPGGEAVRQLTPWSNHSRAGSTLKLSALFVVNGALKLSHRSLIAHKSFSEKELAGLRFPRNAQICGPPVVGGLHDFAGIRGFFLSFQALKTWRVWDPHIKGARSYLAEDQSANRLVSASHRWHAEHVITAKRSRSERRPPGR